MGASLDASVGVGPTKMVPTPQPDLPWPPEPSERCDFYHRTRTFPQDVAEWRKAVIDHLSADGALFPASGGNMSREQIRDGLDEGVSYLREISRILALLHGTPRLGKMDPVDELVCITLAQHMSEHAAQAACEALKYRFRTWDHMLRSHREVVERFLCSEGGSSEATKPLFAALERLRMEFGTCTLEPARTWPSKKLEQFLCSLPEISRTAAHRIMLYSFQRGLFGVDPNVGRVLSRLGPYNELGLSLVDLDGKRPHVPLADLIPPNLRYSLHVNLGIHAKEVCRSFQPLCHRCEIRNFCSSFRRSEVKRVEALGAPMVVDLFSGAGGLSEGFKRAGFRVVLALDQDPVARRTYWLNHPELPDNRLLGCDIRELKPGTFRKLVGRVDVLVGAPPCQGFSRAGFRSKSARTGYRVGTDERNFLFEYMVTAALELQPSLFLMENVPGMNSARQESLSFLEVAAHKLQSLGRYKTAIWKLNASAFGVPQDRIRYFLVASRLHALPSLPHEEYQDVQRADFDVDALPPVTLDEAVFDLPPREAGSGMAVEYWERPDANHDLRHRRYLAKFGLGRESRILFNHTVRYHNPRDLELYALLRPGEDSIHALERYGRHDLMRYRRDVFDDKYARLRGDRPSKTIVSHLAKDGNGYIHPTQVRSISVREAARLQSFHDGYVFCGSPTDQWIQVGNAVPPVLAETIARSFMRLVRRGEDE